MTARSNGNSHDDGSAAGDTPPEPVTSSDLHPAIDPRDPLVHSEAPVPREAPPRDIDARVDYDVATGPPDVIELTDHAATEPPPPPSDVTEPFDPPLQIDPPPPIEDATEESDIPPTEASGTSATSQETGDSSPDDSPDPEPASDATAAAAGTPVGKASSMLSRLTARFRFGKPSKENEEARTTSPDGRPWEPTDPASQAGLAGGLIRAREGFRGFLDPRLHTPDLIPHRRFAGVSALIVLLLLLANSGGLALILLSCVAPILILMTVLQHDVFEKESNLLVAGVTAAGAVVGIVLTALASLLQASQWFDEGQLNFGASGFSGAFGEEAGGAPVLTWLLLAFVFPAVTIVSIAGLPILMRRWPQFRNEVMDGMILASATAAGYAIGATVVYWWPMISDPGPHGEINEWTLRIVGVALLRPMVLTLCGALIGAGVWRYTMAGSNPAAALPTAAGVLGIVLVSVGSVQLQASGAWPELLWTALVLAAVFVLYRGALDGAIETDRKALGERAERVVCPTCRRVTPAGAFCAHCGARLGGEDAIPTPATADLGDTVEETAGVAESQP
jgi:hypothetical protein